MYIAVAVEENDLASRVTSRFEECKFVLIVNMDNMKTKAIENTCDQSFKDLAQVIINHDCEACITGELSPEAFELLAGACVTRYYGYGYIAKEAIVLMEQYALKLIRDVDLGDDCKGGHSEGTCEGHHHD